MSIKLPIPGADLNGVVINTHFLRDVRLGKYNNGQTEPLGDNVLVLGGGNVAIDCARSAVRMGKQVQMACLESRDGMPSHDWEVIELDLEDLKTGCGNSLWLGNKRLVMPRRSK